MHHIYTTTGFIVQSSPHAEAGKFFLIFTRDFGMIGATAQGVRLSQSKLRYHIQDYSFSNFSMVKGKEVWRLTGTKEIPDQEARIDGVENKKVYVRTLTLLKRLLTGEEKNEKLFDVVCGLYDFLSRNILDASKRELVECLTVLRILHYLGYISSKDFLNPLISSHGLDEQTLGETKAQKSQIVKEINNALKESQL